MDLVAKLQRKQDEANRLEEEIFDLVNLVYSGQVIDYEYRNHVLRGLVLRVQGPVRDPRLLVMNVKSGSGYEIPLYNVIGLAEEVERGA